MKTLMRLPGPRKTVGTAGKIVRALVGLFLLLLGYCGFFTFAASFVDYPLSERRAAAPQLRGAYHVHSTLSDGRATVREIAAAAKAAGLQFVILTDHNPVQLTPASYQDGVLVIHGAELSTGRGHLVALGTSRPVRDAERTERPVEAVKALGGTSYLSHPVQKKNPWQDWESAKQATGMELYSADSMFRDAQRSPVTRFLPALGAYLSNPQHGLMTVVNEQPQATERLLELTSHAPKVALCAHDAHGLPPYEPEFRTMAMYLPAEVGGKLPVDPAEAERLVLTELARGRAYCAFHALADGSGFRLDGVPPDRREVQVGQVVRVIAPAAVPPEARVEVRGGGRLLPDGRSVRMVEPGAVQIEVWLLAPGRFFGTEWKPWIVPSPLRVVPAKPPVAPPPPPSP